MHLNKKVQYGVLFVLHLAKVGRTTVEEAANVLNLSKSFLDQIARKLRIEGIVRSIRGPKGGYELNGEPTIGNVLDALGPVGFLTYEEAEEYLDGPSSNQTFLSWIGEIGTALAPIFNQKISGLA